MITSEKTDKIIPAFVKAIGEIGPALKNSTNPHFKRSYADLSAVMDACGEALTANSLAPCQSASEDGARMVTRIYHESGQFIEGYVPLILDKDNMQGLGSALTYARRYGLMSMLNIAPEEDDGNAASEKPIKKAPTQEAKEPTIMDLGKKFAEVAKCAPNVMALQTHMTVSGFDFDTDKPNAGTLLFNISSTAPKVYARCMEIVDERRAELSQPTETNEDRPFPPDAKKEAR